METSFIPTQTPLPAKIHISKHMAHHTYLKGLMTKMWLDSYKWLLPHNGKPLTTASPSRSGKPSLTLSRPHSVWSVTHHNPTQLFLPKGHALIITTFFGPKMSQEFSLGHCLRPSPNISYIYNAYTLRNSHWEIKKILYATHSKYSKKMLIKIPSSFSELSVVYKLTMRTECNTLNAYSFPIALISANLNWVSSMKVSIIKVPE